MVYKINSASLNLKKAYARSDKIKNLLRDKKAVKLDGVLIKLLGFEDMRDFFEDINAWGYARNFTYDPAPSSFQRFLRLYLKENFTN